MSHQELYADGVITPDIVICVGCTRRAYPRSYFPFMLIGKDDVVVATNEVLFHILVASGEIRSLIFFKSDILKVLRR